MGSKDPFESYSLLKVKMNEIEKSKKDEIKETQSSDPNSSTRKSSLPSSSEKDSDIPDRSYGDFYCKICDAHTNSPAMWNSHVTGKKHQKNVKRKVPDTIYEDLDVESSLKYEMRNVKDTIVGLSYIQEIKRKEPEVSSLYKCSLCHATYVTATMVIEHLISLKHRLNYVRENSPDDYELLKATILNKGQMEPLLTEMAVKLKQKFGSGEVKVMQEMVKQQVSSCPSKQPMTDGDDDDEMSNDSRCNDRSKKHNEKNPYVWKASNYHKKDNLKDVKDCRSVIEERKKRVFTSDEDADIYTQKDPVKRTASYSHSKRHRPSSPSYFQESSRMEKVHSRTSYSTPLEDHRKRYPSSPPQELLKNNVHSSRIPTHSPPHEHYHSRSQIQQKESPSSKNHSLATENENQESNSNFDVLKDFVQKVYSLPIEIFLKIVLLKLDNIEVNGIDELCLLSKVITKAQAIFCKKLPPDVEAVVRQKMFRNTNGSFQNTSTSPGINPVLKSSTENKGISPLTEFSFIRDLKSQANRKDPASSVTPTEASNCSDKFYSGSTHGNINPGSSVTPTEASHYSDKPYSGSTHGNINPGSSVPSTEASHYSDISYSGSTHSNINPSSSSTRTEAYDYRAISYSDTTQRNLNPGYQTSYTPPSNASRSYNGASFNMTSSIPGLTLTEGNKQAYTPYDTYQSQYSDPSSANYSQYKY